ADVPTAKPGIEPGIVPAAEGVVDIAVPALKLRPEAGGLVGLSDLHDRPDPDVFNHEMRRDHRDPAHPGIAGAAGIDRGNRSPVGVTQQNAAAKADAVEQL